MQLFLISGLSGSGKSVALKVLEDSGYYCVDNLPVEILPALMAQLGQAGYKRIAVSICCFSMRKQTHWSSAIPNRADAIP
jgi:UPF0042 nucleotide-binding protein